jgi:hypothetical protein
MGGILMDIAVGDGAGVSAFFAGACAVTIARATSEPSRARLIDRTAQL